MGGLTLVELANTLFPIITQLNFFVITYFGKE